MDEMQSTDLHFRFFKNGKLRHFPSRRQVQLQILALLIDCFETGRRYTEKEVNTCLAAVIDCRDVVFFRRELIDCKLLQRERDCSAYWRPIVNA